LGQLEILVPIRHAVANHPRAMRKPKIGKPTVVALAKPDRQALVVRHNKLIESRHSLTLIERRFLLWLVSQIKRDDEDLKIYQVRVADWVEFSGLKKTDNPYKEAATLVDRLAVRNTTIHDEKAERYTVYPWFSYMSYHYGEGCMEASLNPKLKPFLLQLKEQYTSITLEYALLLKSVYAGRIYDLLKQYQAVGERIIDLKELKAMLELGSKYSNFKDFRRRVLDISHDEINAKTDLRMSWQPIKTGRKVTAIHFKFKVVKPQVTLNNREETNQDTQRVFKRLCKHGIEENAARTIIADYDDEYITFHIDLLETKLRDGKANIKSPAGWLVKALKTDHRNPQSLFQKEEAEKRKQAEQQRRKRQYLEQEIERIEQSHGAMLKQESRKLLAALPDQDCQKFDKSFVASLRAGGNTQNQTADKFEAGERDNPFVNIAYMIFTQNHFAPQFPDIVQYAKDQNASTEAIRHFESLQLKQAA